jgi:hypothetical protein
MTHSDAAGRSGSDQTASSRAHGGAHNLGHAGYSESAAAVQSLTGDGLTRLARRGPQPGKACVNGSFRHDEPIADAP